MISPTNSKYICDFTFEDEDKATNFEQASGKALEKLTGGIQVLSSTLSHVILHELTHIPSCNSGSNPDFQLK